MIALFALLGAIVFCWFRGGAIEAIFFNFKNIPALRYFHSAAYGLCFGLMAHTWLGGLIAFVMMTIGQALGWHTYLLEMLHGPKFKGMMHMSLRLLFLTVCCSLPFVIYSSQSLAVCVALCGILGGPIYFASFTWLRRFQGHVLNVFTGAEMVFGAALWCWLGFL